MIKAIISKEFLKDYFVIYFIVIGLFFLTSSIVIYGPFHEDQMYIFFSKSILADGDFNLINQVSEKFKWLVTKEMYFPTSHSTLQTPALIFSYIFEKLAILFTNKSIIKDFHIGAYFIHIISLIVGYRFTKMAVHELGYTLSRLKFLFFVFSSSLFYFSFLYLSVIEIFCFSLSSYLFYMMTLIKNQKTSTINPTILGIVATSLYVAKSSYMFVFLFFVVFIFIETFINKNYKFGLKYLLGFFIAFLPFYLNNITQYGELTYIYGYFTAAFKISFQNAIQTIKVGYFGIGGLFYSNPVYFLSFLGVIYYVSKDLLKRVNYFSVFCLAWLMASFFQTIFLLGPIVDEHYVGRLVLTSLPLLIFGQIVFVDKLNLSNRKLCLFASLFIGLQFYSLFNYLYFDGQSHYAYANTKIHSNFSEVVFYLWDRLLNGSNEIFSDIWFVLLYCSFASLVVYYLVKAKLNINHFFKNLIYVYITIFIFFATLNFKNAKRNSDQYFSNKDRYESTVIGNNGEIYLFNHILDVLESQYRNSDDKTKIEINKLRHAYYLRIKKQLVKSTLKFNKVIKENDFNFGYYSQK